MTPISNTPNTQLVQFCYVMYGLPSTLDYPWSVVLSATIYINTTQITATVNSYGIATLPAYNIIGAVGTRTYTNRYGGTVVL